ncbi:MAG: MFS transporter [Dehalococcoidia bacterium]|nr:MFS transporter [Dehalococcoidia bacterium]
MKIQPGNGTSKKERSLGLLHGEAASSAVETAGCAYQSPSIIAAGADARGVALLSTVTHLVLALLLIKVPSLVEGSRNSLKRTTVIFAIFGSVTWLPIIFITLFVKNVSPFLLIALWTTTLVPTTLLYPLRDSWLASLVPGDKMGRYLSWRSAIAGACYLSTFYMMGFLLDRTIGQQGRSYAFILAIAFLAASVSVVMYCWVRPPVVLPVRDKKPTLDFVTFLKNARKSHLGTFIFFVSLYTFAVNLSGPLFASYMLNDLKFTYMTFATIVSFEYIARIISLTFWGKLVDRSGSLKILNYVSYLIPFIPILWIFSSNFVYLSGVQMLSGTVWAAFDLCVQTFIYKATPPDQRLRYIVYHRSLTSLSVAFGAITGAFLLNNMFSIFGSQILGLFLVSGVLRMVIARVMLPRLHPQGIPDAFIHPELAMELATVNGAPRVGLYYYPQAWKRFTRRAAAIGNNIIGKVSKFVPSQNGLFYKPAKWAEYRNIAGMQTVPVETRGTVQIARDGLFYHPGTWGGFKAESVEKNALSAKRAISHNGLFHNPERWGEYLKQSLAMNAVTMHTGGEGLVLRQPVFYHPELWDRLQKETKASRVNASAKVPSREALLYHPEEWQKYEVQTAGRKGKKPTTRVPVPVTTARYQKPGKVTTARPVSLPARRMRTAAAAA